MIAFVRGTVESYGPDWVVLDQGGLGWLIRYPHCDRISLNEQVMVHTYLHFTENEMSLFGFESQQEKELFLRLISVKGLGPKTALAMLAKSGEQDIITAIESGDVAVLKKMPGIGAKTASQIVLDLKGKLVTVETKQKNSSVEYPQAVRDAMEALKNLGYKPSEINAAGDYMNEKKDLTSNQYLKLGLQFLVKSKLGG